MGDRGDIRQPLPMHRENSLRVESSGVFAYVAVTNYVKLYGFATYHGEEYIATAAPPSE